ncbi:hypothetical protein AOLI_G00200100 [Acnodon oligacanthus]
MVSDLNDMKQEVSKGGAGGCAAPSSSCLSPSSTPTQNVNISAPFVQGRQYTWCRLPQGFRNSSAVFFAVIRDTLASWAPPPDCVVISYADNILPSSTTEDQCRKGSRMLLKHLATCGFKVSPAKLQWSKLSVTYLGFVLAAGERRLSDDRRSVIRDIPPPVTKQAMLRFMSLVNYYKPTHSFVPCDTVLVKTLNPQKVGEAAYGPPTTVIAVTRTAVLMPSSPQWIHASRLKKSPIPETLKTRD